MTERELRVLRALADELRALRQEIHAERQDQQAPNATHDTQPIRPLLVEIKSDPRIPVAIGEHYEAENRYRNSKWRKLVTGLEILGLASAFVLAVLTLLTLLQIRKQTTSIIKAADAADSSAKTANLSLHISERAYLVTSSPTVDIKTKVVTIGLSNMGRLPSGPVNAVIHEVTYIANAIGGITGVADAHWKNNILPPILSGHPLNLGIPIVKIDLLELNSMKQVVVIGGYITYGDGFSDDPTQTLPICSQTQYNVTIKQIYWTPCPDFSTAIKTMEKIDGYPNNEQKN